MAKLIDFFLPREKKFYELLHQAMQNTLTACRKLQELMNDFSSIDDKQRVLLADKIYEIEKKGDEVNHQISRELYDTLVTPIDREDIHELSNLIDDQLDLINKLAKKLSYYNIQEVTPLMKKQMEFISLQMQELALALEALEKNGQVRMHLNKVFALEDDADAVHRKAISDLFSNSHDALEVIKFKDLHDDLENLINANKRVGVAMENIVIKHA